jgi:hypothetical protein
MPSFEYDLGYVQAGLDVLEKYLLSEELFWSLNATPPGNTPEYPKLTLGGLLLAWARLNARPLTLAQQNQVAGIVTDLEAVRTRWRVAWERKAAYSFKVRLRMWRDFIEEYRDNSRDHADRYSYEVRLGVMLHLLKREVSLQNKAEVDLLASLDTFLNAVLKPGVFVWESELEAGFPKDVYGYLYGYLQKNIQ